MSTSPSIVAVVPAAGIGSRMQAAVPKQYLKIGRKTILEHTLAALGSHPCISHVIVATSADDSWFHTLPVASSPWLTRVVGGAQRADSVLSALQQLNNEQWALVHDAARPCLSHTDIDSLLGVINQPGVSGGILATPVRDTMKRATHSPTAPCIAYTESRDNLWHALTPQLFPAGLLRAALLAALAEGVNVTDEASAMEWAGHQVALIDGDPANIKITRPADLPLATFYLQQQDTTCE